MSSGKHRKRVPCWLLLAAFGLGVATFLAGLASGHFRHFVQLGVRETLRLRSATCLGQGRRGFLVYLHGIDSPLLSGQELGNRAILARIAAQHELTIALPRATQPCPGVAGSACWGWEFTQEELAVGVDRILDSAHACFGDPNASFALLGFSNGGYFLTHLYLSGRWAQQLPASRLAIVAGASVYSGDDHGQEVPSSRLPKLVLLSGRNDKTNFDANQELLRHLASRGRDVEQILYEGGHDLDEALLEEVVGRALVEQTQPH